MTDLFTAVEPLIRPIVWSRFRGNEAHGDREDALSEIRLKLLATLNRLRSAEIQPIGDFRAYTARVAFNVCNTLLRTRHPERSQLKMKLRYLLTRDSRFTIERDDPFLCGLARWADPLRISDASLERPTRPIASWTGSPAAFVESLLDQIGAAIGLEELAAKVWDLEGLQRSNPETPRPENALSVPGPSPESEASTRERLHKLWNEIEQLPLRQRIALLLNLRDENNASAIEIFPISGITTIDALASAVGLTSGELARIWGELPLDDLAIAGRLGASRQQVINLRKCARERLARKGI